MEKSLSAKDICSIVKACASSGVTSLTLGELKVTFGDITPGNEPVHTIHYSLPEGLDLTSPETPSTTTQTESLTREDLDQLFIEDPEEYERRLLEDNN